ncbi:hypothetical protein BCL90_5286 [Pedobacter alluvionis]|uniref:Uncharacterized protein n=1 Tax=Pedobacter alluvionis TaxID=475253 RepID=A0A497XRD8_9SPHI|nr:hypothetical protein BCL90_5286 [Pedobacter alluvionis]
MAFEVKNFQYLSPHSSAKLIMRFKSDTQWFGKMSEKFTENLSEM